MSHPANMPGATDAKFDSSSAAVARASMVRPLHARLVVPLLAMCLFAIVAGLKWATVDRFGSAMPDWDQWDAEAAHLLAPWFERDHFLKHLFEPHNEHRVVMTKLENLALTVLNGQWDARLECVANAMVHATLAVAFWVLACAWMGWPERRDLANRPRRDRATVPFIAAGWFMLAVALFGFPLAWQNILGGFHSQQYWLIGLSFAGIVALPFARTWSGAWWAAAAVTALALLTMGSGFLAAAIVFGVVVWRILRRETALRETWPTLVFTLGLIAIGIATRVEVPYHAQLKAKSVHDFVFSILRSLEWPLRDQDWAGGILWLPWLMVAVRALRGTAKRSVETPSEGDAQSSRAAMTLVALGAWVLVQLAATAYARGAGGDYPASRYMDTLTFGAMINGVALGWLVTRGRPDIATSATATRRRALILGFSAAAWLVALGIGLTELVTSNLAVDLPDAKKYYVKAEAHLLGYLTTNDGKQLAFPDIPFPDANALMERLLHRSVRALMPAVVRPSLALETAKSTGTGFSANLVSELKLDDATRRGLSPATVLVCARPTWGSFGANGAADTSTWSSAPLTAPLGGWLRFELTGDLAPGMNDTLSLRLRDAQTGAELARIVPTRTPGNAWRIAHARAPRKPFVIEALDTSTAHWFAFTAPSEVAPLSYFAWSVARHGLLIAEIAAVVAALVAIGSWMLWVRRPIKAAERAAPAI